MEFQETFDLVKEIEEIREPCRANSCEIVDIDILKNFFMDTTLHILPVQFAIESENHAIFFQ